LTYSTIAATDPPIAQWKDEHMTSNNRDDANFSLSLPVGAAVAGVLLATAVAAAFLLLGRTEQTGESTGSPGKSSKSFFRRVGILGLITLIENDATRKVVVAILKAMARRA
jgi:hypothetical protein